MHECMVIKPKYYTAHFIILHIQKLWIIYKCIFKEGHRISFKYFCASRIQAGFVECMHRYFCSDEHSEDRERLRYSFLCFWLLLEQHIFWNKPSWVQQKGFLLKGWIIEYQMCRIYRIPRLPYEMKLWTHHNSSIPSLGPHLHPYNGKNIQHLSVQHIATRSPARAINGVKGKRKNRWIPKSFAKFSSFTAGFLQVGIFRCTWDLERRWF